MANKATGKEYTMENDKETGASEKSTAFTEYEWFWADVCLDVNDYEHRNDVEKIAFRVHMVEEDGVTEDHIYDAAIEAFKRKFSFDDYPDAEVMAIFDDEGRRIVSDADAILEGYCKDHGITYRTFPAARYVLTPKGCFSATLLLDGHPVDTDETEDLWNGFSTTLDRHGYAFFDKDRGRIVDGNGRVMAKVSDRS